VFGLQIHNELSEHNERVRLIRQREPGFPNLSTLTVKFPKSERNGPDFGSLTLK
jgi:hypothetical protein